MIPALFCWLLQDVENPQYKAWAEFKVGSWVRFQKTATKASEGDAVTLSEIETTFTLVEVTEAKVVVRSKGKLILGNSTRELEESTHEIPAKVPKEDPGEAPKSLKRTEGEEELELGGKKIKCRWVEIEVEQGGARSTTRTWTSPEIPGGLARQDSRSEGSASSSSKLSILGWEKK